MRKLPQARLDRRFVGNSPFERLAMPGFLRENGVMTDLTRLIPSGSCLSLIYGSDINDKGEIVEKPSIQTSATPQLSWLLRRTRQKKSWVSSGSDSLPSE
jgi:hypothetical protein